MGNRNYILAILCFTCLILSNNCTEQSDCLKSTGKIISEERIPGNFIGVTLFDDINLSLVQDTIEKVIVKGGENLLYDINSDINNEVLYLKNYNHCKYLRSYQKEILAEVHYIRLKSIVHGGSAKITSDIIKSNELVIWLDGAKGEIYLNLNIDNLKLEHRSGNGYTYLQGTVKNGTINSYAEGLLDLRNLNINNLTMLSDSYNDAYIWVTGTLEVEITSLGNVYYRGDPYIKKYIRTGQGQLIKTD